MINNHASTIYILVCLFERNSNILVSKLCDVKFKNNLHSKLLHFCFGWQNFCQQNAIKKIFLIQS